MRNDRVAAVVVTYNRLPLLQKCIEKLEGQTEPCDILVVNNASSDATAEWLAEQERKNARLHARNTGANIGGAGGFNYGMRWAVEAGYSLLWLMDDDCLPEPNALENLLDADAVLKGDYGWLSSVALWTDGTECKMNRQKLVKNARRRKAYINYGLLQANQATFVSLLLNAKTVRRVGLPIKEFFIWGDDIEYTRRIAIREKLPSFVVEKSRVLHAMKDNNGSSIATDREERIDRYCYAFRNEAFTYRQEGVRGICYYIAKCALNFCRILVKAPGQKAKRIIVLSGSMVRGMAFCPKIERL